MSSRKIVYSILSIVFILVFALSACAPAANNPAPTQPQQPTQAAPAQSTATTASQAAAQPTDTTAPQAAAQPTATTAAVQATTPPLPTQKPVSGNRVKVNWWFNISNEADMKAYIAGVDAFNASQDKIDLIIVPGQNNDAFITAITGNTAPDLFITWDGGEPLGTWAQNGLIQPLDQYIAADNIDLTKFHDASVAMGTYNGKVYGVPWQADIVLLFYNKKQFKEAGLDPDKPPTTWAEAMAMGQKLTLKDASGKITRMGLQPPTWFGPYYSIMCAWKPEFLNMVDMTNKKINADQPGIVASFQLMKDLWNMYGDPQQVDAFNSTLGNGLSPDDPFLTGKVSMIIDGDWRNGYESRYTNNKFNVDYGMVPIPAPVGLESTYGASYFFGMNFVIPYNAPHAAEAMQAVKYLTSYENDVKVIQGMWNNPVNKAALQDKDLLAMSGLSVQMNSLRENGPKMCYLPVTPVTGQLSAAIQQQIDLVVHNKITPEEGAKAINDAVQPELDAVK